MNNILAAPGWKWPMFLLPFDNGHGGTSEQCIINFINVLVRVQCSQVSLPCPAIGVSLRWSQDNREGVGVTRTQETPSRPFARL